MMLAKAREDMTGATSNVELISRKHILPQDDPVGYLSLATRGTAGGTGGLSRAESSIERCYC